MSASDLASVFEILEDQLWDAEYSNIRDLTAALGSEYNFLNRDFVQACAMRFSELRGKARHYSLLQIDSIRTGSLIVEFSIVAVALWVVKSTVGESFKEAYKNSDLHRHLTKFFLMRQQETLEWAVDGLRHILQVRGSKARVTSVKKLTGSSDVHWLVVDVQVSPNDLHKSPATYSQATDDFNKEIGGS